MGFVANHVDYVTYIESTFPRPKKDEAGHPFGSRESIESRTKRKNQARYESRNNVCPRCFVTKSVQTKSCNCD